MLQVQKYLRSGKTVANLKEEFGINCNKRDGLILLKYDQIDSSKFKTHPIVCECRGLILEEATLEIVSMPFYRFFNYGEEGTKDFFETDVDKIFIEEKRDGSLISLFNFNDRWMIATSGTIEGTGQVGFCNMTFRQLFDITVKQYDNFYEKLNEDYTYVFELTAPENKVVTTYHKRDLTLLTIRRNFYDSNNKVKPIEIYNNEMLENIAQELDVNYPKYHKFTTVNELLGTVNTLKNLEEGFVCVKYVSVDGVDVNCWQRVKVKSPDYLAAAHIRESSASSLWRVLKLVVSGDEQEFLIYFPEFTKTINNIKDVYEKYYTSINVDIEKAQTMKHLDRKSFAAFAKTTVNLGLMFLVYDSKINCFNDWKQQTIDKYLSTNSKANETDKDKYFYKKLLENLGLKDVTFEM